MTESILKNARIPRSLSPFPQGESVLVDCDIRIQDGLITAVDPAGSGHASEAASVNDLQGRIVMPGFLDAHVHIDKAFTWDRAPNVRGEFWDAIELLSKDKENWTAEDLYRRGTFALRCAEAHGSVALRTHVDTGLDWGEVSHDAMQTLRQEWAGRIDLQTVSLCGIESYLEPAGRRIAEWTLKHPNALLGGMPQMNPDLDKQLRYFFDLAAEMGVGVDLHVDENGNAEAECLRHIAQIVLEKEFPHPVTCGHVCSLAVQDAERAASTIDLVREAGVQIISLPLCNLYLQGRPTETGHRGTPRWRGVTLLHELHDAGVTTACASDNVRDAFYAWGDFDMFEVFTQSIRIAHLDTKPAAACAMVTSGPAAIMGLSQYGKIAVGMDARMVAFAAKSFNELLSRPNQTRELIGYHSDASSVPAYDEL
ncbi:cytosine deaminase [Coraliomargarita algicola]|uniref:Cytosine deaminase n=1 Tax=Coraliomargarita algicola TaxID=3092156 RepID=A0ABZ0REX3_9BACT|nr:cytosine deaminase [Coraliomargarita sp. J2-16]WPJ94586.1 cytosine deaminase [Coraliomargarita sp. J2-16]